MCTASPARLLHTDEAAWAEDAHIRAVGATLPLLSVGNDAAPGNGFLGLAPSSPASKFANDWEPELVEPMLESPSETISLNTPLSVVCL